MQRFEKLQDQERKIAMLWRDELQQWRATGGPDDLVAVTGEDRDSPPGKEEDGRASA
jgi:hypothetical protein